MKEHWRQKLKRIAEFAVSVDDEWIYYMEDRDDERHFEYLENFIESAIQEERKRIANDFTELRDKNGRNIRFYLLPHFEHKPGDDGEK